MEFRIPALTIKTTKQLPLPVQTDEDKLIYTLDVFQQYETVTIVCLAEKSGHQVFVNTYQVDKNHYDLDALENFLLGLFVCTGVPDIVITDIDRKFNCEDFNEFLEKHNIEHHVGCHNARTKGKIENIVRQLQKGKKFDVQNDDEPFRKAMLNLHLVITTDLTTLKNRVRIDYANKLLNTIEGLLIEAEPSFGNGFLCDSPIYGRRYEI